MTPVDQPPNVRRKDDADFRWESVAKLPYKEGESAPFKSISRQLLFADPHQRSELRYFEVAPGGHSTLERHAHAHAVMILRGEGHCLIGTQVHRLATHDLVAVPPWTWHQFRATGAAPLGFLCLVDAERDRPQLPTAQDLAELEADETIAAFLGRSGTP